MKKKQSKVVGVHDCKDIVESDRIEWLKQLHAEWLEKRNSILKYNNETYPIYELEEFDTEVFS